MIQSAKNAYDSGKFIDALELYRQIYEKDSQDFEALEGLARSCNKLKKYEDGRKYCHLALSLNDSLAWPHCVLSYINHVLGQRDESKNEAALALRISPDQWEPNYLWGTLLFLENKDDEAILFLEKASSIDPNNWYVYNSLSIVYGKNRELPKHYYALKQMYRLKPTRLLAFRIHYGEHRIFYSISLGVFYWLLTYSAMLFKITALLWLPALLSVLFTMFGIIMFIRRGFVRQSLAVGFILFGIFSGYVVWLVYSQIK